MLLRAQAGVKGSSRVELERFIVSPLGVVVHESEEVGVVGGPAARRAPAVARAERAATGMGRSA